MGSIDGDDSQISAHKTSAADYEVDLRELQTQNASLLSELESLRASYPALGSKFVETEENNALLQPGRDEALSHNCDLEKAIEQVSNERDSLHGQAHGIEFSLRDREDEFVREKEAIRDELLVSREKVKELLNENTEKARFLSENLEELRSVKECLARLLKSLDEDNFAVHEHEEADGNCVDDELGRAFSGEVEIVSRLASDVERKLSAYEERRRKEKRELENREVSLTEEDRDVITLLKTALVEREAVEKSLNKLKGNNGEYYKIGAILQIAERGLHRVGFGFMMGTTGSDKHVADDLSGKSHGSECKEEVVSLV